MDDVVQDDSDHVLPPMKEGDRVKLIGDRAQPAFHRAAAALLRSVPGQGAGRVRHRPAVDLRIHYFHVARPPVRRYRKPALHGDGHRQDRQPLPDPILHHLRGLRLHGKDGRFARRRGERRAGMGASAREDSGSPSSIWSITPKPPSAAKKSRRRAILGKDPVSGKPMSVRMGRFGPFVQIGTKDDEDKPRFAGLRPGQKMDADHSRAGDGAVQTAAQAWAHRGGRGNHHQRRPFRPLCEVRRQVRFARRPTIPTRSRPSARSRSFAKRKSRMPIG